MDVQHPQRFEGHDGDDRSRAAGASLWAIGYSADRDGGLVAVFAAMIAVDRAGARAEFGRRLGADVDPAALVRGLGAADPFAELLVTEALAAEMRRVAAAPDDPRHRGYWVRLERAFAP